MSHTLMLAVIALAAVACGSPAPERREFVFTPVTYTPIPEQAGCPICSRARACTAEGDGFYADRVDMTVEVAREDQVTAVVESYGFVTLSRFDNGSEPNVRMLIEVPPGSSPDAAAALAKERGVIAAEPSDYAFVDRDPCGR